MTIHKVKEQFVLKASFGELFSALSGIASAGVTVVKKGADTKADPVASLAYDASILSYDIKTELSFNRMEAERAAFKITTFLNASRGVLVAHAETRLSLPKGEVGGKLADVVSHIDDILTREAIGSDRMAAKFVNGGLQEKFEASYLPKAGKAYDEEEGMDDPDGAMHDAPEPERKAPAKTGGRKTYAWQSRIPAVV